MLVDPRDVAQPLPLAGAEAGRSGRHLVRVLERAGLHGQDVSLSYPSTYLKAREDAPPPRCDPNIENASVPATGRAPPQHPGRSCWNVTSCRAVESLRMPPNQIAGIRESSRKLVTCLRPWRDSGTTLSPAGRSCGVEAGLNAKDERNLGETQRLFEHLCVCIYSCPRVSPGGCPSQVVTAWPHVTSVVTVHGPLGWPRSNPPWLPRGSFLCPRVSPHRGRALRTRLTLLLLLGSTLGTPRFSG